MVVVGKVAVRAEGREAEGREAEEKEVVMVGAREVVRAVETVVAARVVETGAEGRAEEREEGTVPPVGSWSQGLSKGRSNP